MSGARQADERGRVSARVRTCHHEIVMPRNDDRALGRAWPPLGWWLVRAWQPVRWWRRVRAPGVMWPVIAAYLALFAGVLGLLSGHDTIIAVLFVVAGFILAVLGLLNFRD